MKQIKNRLKSKNKYSYGITITLLSGTTNGSSSYLDADVFTDIPSLSYLNDSLYDLWCIDTEIGFDLGATYNDYFCFSLSETQLGINEVPLKTFGILKEGPIYYKSELNKINWLVNQNYIGKDPFGIGSNISAGNIQQAIWILLNQYPSTYTPNARVQALLDITNEQKNDFMPTIGQKQGIIISNFTKDTNNIRPRTQPYLLMVQSCELKFSPNKILLRKLSKSRKYLKLQTSAVMLNLTPGFEYFIKNKHDRAMTKIILEPGESYETT